VFILQKTWNSQTDRQKEFKEKEENIHRINKGEDETGEEKKVLNPNRCFCSLILLDFNFHNFISLFLH
jgi:hypothetical protein